MASRMKSKLFGRTHRALRDGSPDYPHPPALPGFRPVSQCALFYFVSTWNLPSFAFSGQLPLILQGKSHACPVLHPRLAQVWPVALKAPLQISLVGFNPRQFLCVSFLLQTELFEGKAPSTQQCQIHSTYLVFSGELNATY